VQETHESQHVDRLGLWWINYHVGAATLAMSAAMYVPSGPHGWVPGLEGALTVRPKTLGSHNSWSRAQICAWLQSLERS
jgi:hypothetical protein